MKADMKRMIKASLDPLQVKLHRPQQEHSYVSTATEYDQEEEILEDC